MQKYQQIKDYKYGLNRIKSDKSDYIHHYITRRRIPTYSMIGFQVVNLLLEKLRPEILADELDGLKMITESRPLHGILVRKTIINMLPM